MQFLPLILYTLDCLTHHYEGGGCICLSTIVYVMHFFITQFISCSIHKIKIPLPDIFPNSEKDKTVLDLGDGREGQGV